MGSRADGRGLDVQEGAPTSDQLISILEYLGPSKAGSVIQDATGTSDALRKFRQNESSFKQPVMVDWNNGRAGTCLPLGRARGAQDANWYISGGRG